MMMTIYHGTDCLFDEIDLPKCENNRDFGIGFYTTTICAQAESWARTKKFRNGSKHGYVYVYEVDIQDTLKVLEFKGLTIEWLDMIKRNRRYGGIQNDFDTVIGPVASDDTRVTVLRYMDGTYTAEEAINRLKYSKANDQVTFHTKRSLSTLKFKRRYCVE